MEVKTIKPRRAKEYVMNCHYAQRWVNPRYTFGLFVDGEMVGCVLYSMPASYTLCKGVCGPEYKSYVIELSRLVIVEEIKNGASFLIGRSLRRLGNWVVVSYADCNSHVGHVGYVYQATNWIYTGTATAEPKWIDPTTGKVVSYTRRHIDKKAETLGMDWRSLVKVPQQGKHRYVTFTGDRRFRKRARENLRYSIKDYPKGDTRRHGRVSVPGLF